MKQLLCAALMLLAISSAGASDKGSSLRGRYTNIAFVSNTMTQENFIPLKSNFGVALTKGNTYFLHSRSLGDVVRFGIDATWFDISYTNYKLVERESDYSYGYDDDYTVGEDGIYEKHTTFHQLDAGLQVGPSVSLTPVGSMAIHCYARYAPTYSCMFDGGEFRGNFANFVVAGLAVSYKAIGVGFEGRWGWTKYILGESDFYDYDEDHDDSYTEAVDNKIKTTFKGFRAYITFKF